MPGIADVDLEHEPGRRLDVVAQRVAEIRRRRRTRPSTALLARRPPSATFSGPHREHAALARHVRARRTGPQRGRARVSTTTSLAPPPPVQTPAMKLLVPTKSATKRLTRPLVELLGRRHLQHAAVAHHRHAIGERQRLLLVVGDVDRGDAELLLQLRISRAHLRRGSWRRGSTAARRAAGCRGSARAPAPAPPAAAGRPRAAPDSAPRGPSRLTLRSPSAQPRARSRRPAASAGGARSVTLPAHRHVRPQRVVLEHHADVALVRRQPVDPPLAEADLAAVRRGRTRRSAAAASSCRSPRARAA